MNKCNGELVGFALVGILILDKSYLSVVVIYAIEGITGFEVMFLSVCKSVM